MTDPRVPLFEGTVAIALNPPKDYNFYCCVQCHRNVFLASDSDPTPQPALFYATPLAESGPTRKIPNTQRVAKATTAINVIHEACVYDYETRRIADWMNRFKIQARHTRKLQAGGQTKIDMIDESHKFMLKLAQRYGPGDQIEFCLDTFDNNEDDLSFLVQVRADADSDEMLPVKELDLWPSFVQDAWFTHHTVIELHVSKRNLSDERVTFERFTNELVNLVKMAPRPSSSLYRAWIHRVASSNATLAQYKVICLFQPLAKTAAAAFDVPFNSITWNDLVIHPEQGGNVGIARQLYDAQSHAVKYTAGLFDSILGKYAPSEDYTVKRTQDDFITVPWATAQYINEGTGIGIAVNAQRFKHNSHQYFWNKRMELLVYQGAAPDWWPIQVGERARLEAEIAAEGAETLAYQTSANVIKAI
jgi:hypothetical protein